MGLEYCVVVDSAAVRRRIRDLMDLVLREGWGPEGVSVSSQKAQPSVTSVT